MKIECLFKKHLVLHGPLVWKWSKIRQIGQSFFKVVLMPEQHAKCLHKIRNSHYLYISIIKSFNSTELQSTGHWTDNHEVTGLTPSWGVAA